MLPGRGSLLLCLLLAVPVGASGQALQRPDTTRASVAHAVLFFSPACPHCRDLVTTGLPPILQRFGERLVIVGVDVTTENGQAQYQSMVRRFAVTAGRQAVPTLVMGTRVLVGSVEIPSELPGLVERGLAAGGVDWPDLPLLRQALAARGMLGPRPAAAESAGAAPARPLLAARAAAPAPERHSPLLHAGPPVPIM
jgi:thiol-disulfide isomerase/thioredoxin